jgi:putative nucleotidyltransferase with HDIG domain
VKECVGVGVKHLNVFDAEDIIVPLDQVAFLSVESRVVDALFGTILMRDTITANHSLLMAYYNYMISTQFDSKNSDLYFIAGLVHDIGKLSLSDSILKSTEKLKDSEIEFVKVHVTEGAKLLRRAGLPDLVVNTAMYHHERFDGSGYVEGLSGYDIPLEGRISAIADVYSTLVGGRLYSSALSEDRALDILNKEKHLFDPDILNWFVPYISGRKVKDIVSSRFLMNFAISKYRKISG